MTTEVGRIAKALLLERAMVRPPTGAFPLNVTIPVEVDPPKTVLGLTLVDNSTGGLIVKVAV